MSHFDICSKQKSIFYISLNLFLAFFSTLPSTQIIQVFGLIFSMSWPWQIGLWICILIVFSNAFSNVYTQIQTHPPLRFYWVKIKTNINMFVKQVKKNIIIKKTHKSLCQKTNFRCLLLIHQKAFLSSDFWTENFRIVDIEINAWSSLFY